MTCASIVPRPFSPPPCIPYIRLLSTLHSHRRPCAANMCMQGKWHLFVSEITEGCGLFYWDKNSQCTHAVADSIEGPYAKQDVALPVWAHSCRAFRDHKTGTWLLFHVGEGNPGNGGGEVNCTHNASHPPLAGPSTSSAVDPKHMATTSGYLHNASSPEGPWEPVVPLGWSFPHSTNPGERLLPAQCGDPAPFQHDDGSWSMVCDTFPDDFFVATAPYVSHCNNYASKPN